MLGSCQQLLSGEGVEIGGNILENLARGCKMFEGS